MDHVRYGLRQVRRNPGFAAIVIITLALGIGANTAMFSLIEGILLAPLPYANPSRLVFVWQSNTRSPHVSISGPDFYDWQYNAHAFAQMAAIRWQARDLTKPGAPEHVEGREISSGFFTLLGVKLALGRDFSAEDDRRGGPPVVLISNRLWRARFDGSREVLGRSVTLDGASYTVVGVLPAEFSFGGGGEADVYTPLQQGNPVVIADRAIHPGILCIGRLNPGTTIVQAKSEMASVQHQLDLQYPVQDRGLGVDVVPLKQEIVGNVGDTLLLLMGAVGLVLLIACANTANLFLARSEARSSEFSIRSALGAGRWDLVYQGIGESMILSLGGGIIGLAIAKWGILRIVASVPSILPRSKDVSLDIPVLLFTFGLSVVVGILFGLAPALKSSKSNLQISLKQAGRGVLKGRRHLQRGLVIFQMALTVVLLSGAVLLFRTVRHLWAVDPGFSTQHILTFKVGLSPAVTKAPPTWRTAYQQLLDRIQQIPSVQAADVTALIPLSQLDNSVPFWVASRATTSAAEAPRALLYWTGPQFLKTMELHLLQGRFLTPEDTTSSEPVIVIDSVLAHTYFHDQNPVGQALQVASWAAPRIVGVVAHVRHWGLGDAGKYTQNQIYASIYQLPDQWVPVMYPDLTVVARSQLDQASLLPSLKEVFYGAGKDQPIYAVTSMQDIASESITTQRFPMFLLGSFALLAFVLASVGIYGVISYLTTERVHEIGIRMALGAERTNVLQMVVEQGFQLAMIGIVMGMASALILSRLLSSFSHLLYGVRSWDPLTLVAVSLLLIVAAVLACYIPARRAAGVDPMIALRHD